MKALEAIQKALEAGNPPAVQLAISIISKVKITELTGTEVSLLVSVMQNQEGK